MTRRRKAVPGDPGPPSVPATPAIPYGHQHVDTEDVEAVAAVLRSVSLTTGPAVSTFERRLAETCEVDYAVAFSSGTAALHGAAVAAGLGPGQTLYTSPLSFAASAACAVYVGAAVGLVDIAESTLNIDLRKCPSGANALVPVHYAGLPVDLSLLPGGGDSIVIEDAAHALGARTADGPVGNCARSHMCVFSFHPVKVITTGEGGAVTTNDAGLAEILRRFRHHGIRPKPELGGWYYEIPVLGMNYRLSDIHAALGTSQLAKLESFVGRRNEIAERYRELLRPLPLVLPPPAPVGAVHAYHLFPIRVSSDARRSVFDHMRAAGIGVQVHYVPIYRHAAYWADGTPDEFPNTETAYQQLLSLPIYPDLSDAEQDYVVHELATALGA